MRVARISGLLLVAAVACILSGCILVDDLDGCWEKGVVDPQLQGYWKQIETPPTPVDITIPLPGGGTARGQLHGSTSSSVVEETYISFQRSGDHYLAQHIMLFMLPNAPKVVREVKSLVLGKHNFLMSGATHTTPAVFAHMMVGQLPHGLFRYSISDNVLILYRLDESTLRDAIAQGKVTGRWPSQDIDFFSNPEQAASMIHAIRKLDDASAAFLESVADQPDCWKTDERFRRVADIEKEMNAVRRYPAGPSTAASACVGIKLSDLEYFAEGRTDVLLRQLEASPEWMVSEDGSDLVAYRRERLDSGAWTVDPYSGFGRMSEAGVLTRQLFRFAEQPAGRFADPFNRPMLTVAPPQAGTLRLNLAASGCDRVQSYLAVGRKGLWLEIYEQSQEEKRVQTREALWRASEFLRKVRELEPEIRQLGFAASLMPPNSYKRGEPSLEVSGSEPAGAYDVVAWANPGKDGYVYLRVFNADTGAELSSSDAFVGPSEFVGWSDDPQTLFRYDSMVALHSVEGEARQFAARIELWLHPSDGGPEEKLVETICQVEVPPRRNPAVMR